MLRRRTAATLVAAALAALVLVGCGSGSDGSDAGGDPSEVSLAGDAATTEAGSPTTGAPASSDTTVPASTTTAPPATTGLATQEETVARLYDAWYADDRVTAATVAEPEAVDGMWEAARGDYSLYSACSTGEFDTSGCLYRGANGTIQFTLERRGDFWVVISAFYAEP